MKSIKEIAVIMAILGASIGLNAQTNDRPVKKNVNSEQSGTTESQYQDPSDKTRKKGSNDHKRDMHGTDYKHSGKKTDNDKSDMNGGYKKSGSKSSGDHRSAMNQPTYQQIPEQQDKTKVSVPEAVKVSFNNDYYTRDITPTWKKEGENFRADFRNGSIGSTAVYDKNGKLIESDRELGDGEYPDAISSYGGKINGSARVWESNRDGEIKYFIKEESGHKTWFDKDGKHIAAPDHVAHHVRSYK